MDARKAKITPENNQNLIDYIALITQFEVLRQRLLEIRDGGALSFERVDQLKTLKDVGELVGELQTVVPSIKAIQKFMDEFAAKRDDLLNKMSPEEKEELERYKRLQELSQGDEPLNDEQLAQVSIDGEQAEQAISGISMFQRDKAAQSDEAQQHEDKKGWRCSIQ